MHIPPHLHLPQDKVDVLDLGPSDPGEPPAVESEHEAWAKLKTEWEAFRATGCMPTVTRMHISDAKHAMSVEPDRYKLAGVKQEKPAEPEKDDDGE